MRSLLLAAAVLGLSWLSQALPTNPTQPQSDNSSSVALTPSTIHKVQTRAPEDGLILSWETIERWVIYPKDDRYWTTHHGALRKKGRYRFVVASHEGRGSIHALRTSDVQGRRLEWNYLRGASSGELELRSPPILLAFSFRIDWVTGGAPQAAEIRLQKEFDEVRKPLISFDESASARLNTPGANDDLGTRRTRWYSGWLGTSKPESDTGYRYLNRGPREWSSSADPTAVEASLAASGITPIESMGERTSSAAASSERKSMMEGLARLWGLGM